MRWPVPRSGTTDPDRSKKLITPNGGLERGSVGEDHHGDAVPVEFIGGRIGPNVDCSDVDWPASLTDGKELIDTITEGAVGFGEEDESETREHLTDGRV